MSSEPGVTQRDVRLLTGVTALLAPGLYIVSDALEWAGGGFSTPQLYTTYVAFLPVPFLMVGLYAVQRPRMGWVGLLGAVLYGVAFIYFAHTALYALTDRTADYETLLRKLGATYTVHGGLMVVGGLAFGMAVLRAGLLPRWTGAAFLLGVALNLLFGLAPVPAILQTIASTSRNLGLMGMGAALLGRPPEPAGDRRP